MRSNREEQDKLITLDEEEAGIAEEEEEEKDPLADEMSDGVLEELDLVDPFNDKWEQ